MSYGTVWADARRDGYQCADRGGGRSQGSRQIARSRRRGDRVRRVPQQTSPRASLLLPQGGEAPARRGSIGLDYSFDKRVLRQVFVILSYDCLGLL
jgi:hypothetical protein